LASHGGPGTIGRVTAAALSQSPAPRPSWRRGHGDYDHPRAPGIKQKRNKRDGPLIDRSPEHPDSAAGQGEPVGRRGDRSGTASAAGPIRMMTRGDPRGPQLEQQAASPGSDDQSRVKAPQVTLGRPPDCQLDRGQLMRGTGAERQDCRRPGLRVRRAYHPATAR